MRAQSATSPSRWALSAIHPTAVRIFDNALNESLIQKLRIGEILYGFTY